MRCGRLGTDLLGIASNFTSNLSALLGFYYHLVCLFILRHLLFPSRGGRTWTLTSESKKDEADFKDWMSI